MMWRASVAFCSMLVAGACSAPPTDPPQPPTARHVLLITIDTLRADRLGCYGNRQVRTPHIDRLAREGAMAPAATTHVPLTRPAHVSLFTGTYPAEHGIRDNVSPSLATDVPTLAELLRSSGFRTAAFIGSIVLSKQSGLARGFDAYSDRFEVGSDDARFLNTIQKRGDEVTAEAVAWLRSQAGMKPSAAAGERAGASGRRLFAWVHLYDPHDPYAPPEPYASDYAERPYDGEVAWSDELLGRLDRVLADLGMRDQTLIIVTSDHGEGLGEHGESVHGFFVYETTLRIPLILRGPGVGPGLRLAATARIIDLFPTVLDLVGVDRPAGVKLSGRSLAEALRGRASLGEEPSFGESLLPLLHYGWSDLRTIRDGRWKYILAPRPELYDLVADPGEVTNLASANPARARALRAGLERQLKREQTASRTASGTASVPPDLLEKLGALGYVGAGGPAEGSPSAGADPKDKIDEYKVLNRLMREGLIKLRENEYAAAGQRFRTLLARGAESFEVHYYLGRALAGQDRSRAAAGHFEKAIKRLPAYGPAYLALADSRTRTGDVRGAIAALRQGQAASPGDPRLFEREAEAWRRLGNRREAIRAYEAELPLAPDDALVRVRLGELYRDAGDAKRAIDLLRAAVGLEPGHASYWNSLGMVLGGNNDLPAAEAAFREAVRRDPANPQYTYNLGLALHRQGRSQEALPFFQRTLQLDPRFAAARERLAGVTPP